MVSRATAWSAPFSRMSRQGYPFLPRGLPEAHRGRSRAVSWTSRRQQSRLNMGEDRHDVTCAGAKVEEQVPRPGDELRPPVHDFLQYGLQATTHGRMSDRRQFADQPQLADQTQTVVGEHRDMQHRIVGIELARGQSFQIEVGLDLRMELLVRAVILVALDDPFRRFGQAGPPAFDLDRRVPAGADPSCRSCVRRPGRSGESVGAPSSRHAPRQCSTGLPACRGGGLERRWRLRPVRPTLACAWQRPDRAGSI
jgi:hypothetical protein